MLTQRLINKYNFAMLNRAVVKITGVDTCRIMGNYVMHVQILILHPIWYLISWLHSWHLCSFTDIMLMLLQKPYFSGFHILGFWTSE